ncbi:hypothetical protein HPP92_003974 [Vanilla planifolia]|uniref:LOB domain-containing protein n=1 Tax=Vanilla planifolia TaxID=51239 RepID=A0A835VJG3_VANPL|nr:hypothetical protein HPP92_003974 [Vanilla planifolia]
MGSPSDCTNPDTRSNSPSPAAQNPASDLFTSPPFPACAACKYQRRKCSPNCALAPYFPADQKRHFLNAHRLFGLSKMLKTISKLHDPILRAEAMRSIIFQSNARACDPVGGCYGIILELEAQIRRTLAQLDVVQRQLADCRAAQASNPNPNPNLFLTPMSTPISNDPIPTASGFVYNYPVDSHQNRAIPMQEGNESIQMPLQNFSSLRQLPIRCNAEEGKEPFLNDIDSWNAAISPAVPSRCCSMDESKQLDESVMAQLEEDWKTTASTFD